MSRSFTKAILLLWTLGGLAQSKPIDLNQKDTITRKYAYGLRVGIDLSRPVLSYTNDNYTGFEIVGDYRLTDKWYLAAELGNEERTQDEDLSGELLYEYTTSGSYIKAGGDYNTYTNWYGMRNQITVGGRYAFSSFSQTLNNFNFFNSNRFFSPNGLVSGSTEELQFENLTASWLEFVVGLKAELFANIYIGMSIRLGHLVTNTDPDNFRNLWIPGFNKVTENSKWGVGYNYSLSYFIPLYKKVKKRQVDASSE